MEGTLSVAHLLAAILASWRLTELVTLDRISGPFRRRFPHYLWGCPRCVSVWAGIFCTLAFVYAPWLNWPLALAWLYLVRIDWVNAVRAFSLPRMARPIAGGSDLWAGVLDPSRAVTWEDPGVHIAGQSAGIPTRATICSTLDSTATAAQINTAIAGCPAGQVVFLGAGTYSLSSGLDLATSNVTLRGAGPKQTILDFSGVITCSGPTASICVEGSFNWSGGPQHLTTWTAGYAAGTTIITLGSTAGLSVGQVLILDQANDLADTGNIFVNDTIPFSSEGGSPGRVVGGTTYSQQEYKRVTAINGTQVTITPPIYMPNWRSGQSPSAWWATALVENVGIENLTLLHNSSNDSGIYFFNAYNSWVKNVRSVYATSGAGGGRNHVWYQYSARVTVRDSYFYGTRNASVLSYGLEPWQSGDLLAENNIFQHIVSPLVIGNTTGSVFAYNYSIDHFNNNATFNMPGPSFTHDAGNSMNLYESNQGTGMVEDDIHGTHNLHTYFRNQWNGRDPGKDSQTIPSEICAYSRYMNVVGNVMGEAGYHNNYQAVTPTTTNCTTSIYILGFRAGDCSTASSDTLVSSTLMRWGNYDVVSDAVRFVTSEDGSGAPVYPAISNPSQSFSASFYLSLKPTLWWSTPWGTPPWPAIGPDVSGGNATSGTGGASTLGGHAYKIPARLCYENMVNDGGNPYRSFDAAACYTGSSSPSALPAFGTGIGVKRVVRRRLWC